MNISDRNLRASTVKKMRWEARILSVVTIITMFIVSGLITSHKIYGEPPVPFMPFPWNEWILSFLLYDGIAILSVIIAWKWSYVGGVCLIVVAGYMLFQDLITSSLLTTSLDITIEHNIITPKYSMWTPLYSSLYVFLIVAGITNVVIGWWKRKNSALAG